MECQIVHTCIRVMDLEKSLKFYQEALGLKEVRRKDYPEHEFTLVFLRDDAGSHEIELTYNYHPEKPYIIGNGFSHIAVITDDLESMHQRHQAMGYKVSKLTGLPGSKANYYFVTDPDGYEIEVIRKK